MPKVPEGYLRERRHQILVAASHVFSKRGVQAATMGEVASEAGISPGLIYRYFPSKDDLVACAMSESSQDLEARWHEAPVNHPDPLGEFLALSAQTFGALEDPEEQRHTVMYVEQHLNAARDGDPAALAEVRANHEAITHKIQLRLDAARRAGQLHPDADTKAMAQVAVDFYWGTRMRLMAMPDARIGPAVRAFMKMMASAYAPSKTD